MESVALQILLWDDDDCNEDSDMEFLEDLYACMSMALLDIILGYVCSTTSPTDFRYGVLGMF